MRWEVAAPQLSEITLGGQVFGGVQKQIKLDAYSAVALLLESRYGNVALAGGTCFVWKADSAEFLITNWHNVTGRNPITGAALGQGGGEPDRLIVAMHVAGQPGAWSLHEVRLFDDSDDPVWFEHPTHGRAVDVVAIPLTYPAHLTSYPLNMIPDASTMQLAVGHDVFILGFPFMLSGGGALPIWKRASVATEPDIDQEGLPKIRVDTASRGGMSGAPVLRRTRGSYTDENGNIFMVGGASTRFVGVYSGRLGAEDEFKAQLGIVWRASLVEEIVRGKRRGAI